ncbi:MAG: hypothetical protein WC483_04700 [Candidatus Paceibacterota bacterium]
MEEDKELKEAVAACAKIIGEKCGNKPFMLAVSKADVMFATDEDREKGIVSGTAHYMYIARPTLRKNGLSKLLIDTARVALNQAEKKISEESES